MASSFVTAKDLDLERSLWESLSDLIAPPPASGQPTTVVLLDQGFAPKPESYDPSTSTGRLNFFKLCDQLPSYSPGSVAYNASGSTVSALWKALMTTAKFDDSDSIEKKDARLRKQYQAARDKLFDKKYGKTAFYKSLDTARQEMDDATVKLVQYQMQLMVEFGADWKSAYEATASTYVGEVKQATVQYQDREREIARYEGVLFAHSSASLIELVQNLNTEFNENLKVDPESGESFYATTASPDDWYKWFDPNYIPDESWTQVTVSQQNEYNRKTDTFTKKTGSSHSSFMSYVAGGSGSRTETHTTHFSLDEASDVEISFSYRVVHINRLWFEMWLLHYQKLGMNDVGVREWSTGAFDDSQVEKQFPFYPTGFVVARDITVVAKSYSKKMREVLDHLEIHQKVKVFGITVHESTQTYDHKSVSSSYDPEKNKLIVHGAQVIGWVCDVVPPFPLV